MNKLLFVDEVRRSAGIGRDHKSNMGEIRVRVMYWIINFLTQQTDLCLFGGAVRDITANLAPKD